MGCICKCHEQGMEFGCCWKCEAVHDPLRNALAALAEKARLLDSALAELKEHRAGTCGGNDYKDMRRFQSEFMKADHKARDLELQVGDLRDALDKYGVHESNCPSFDQDVGDSECSCGLMKALAKGVENRVGSGPANWDKIIGAIPDLPDHPELLKVHPLTCGECRAEIRTDICPACAAKAVMRECRGEGAEKRVESIDNVGSTSEKQHVTANYPYVCWCGHDHGVSKAADH